MYRSFSTELDLFAMFTSQNQCKFSCRLLVSKFDSPICKHGADIERESSLASY